MQYLCRLSPACYGLLFLCFEHTLTQEITTSDKTGHTDSCSISRYHETLNAMKRGVPIIYQGVLHNNRNYTMGSPDLIVRSDFLENLVHTNPIDKTETNVGCNFSNDWHYRIVDIKYCTMRLCISNDRVQEYSSTPAYKTQLAIYNEALGQAQGIVPPEAYILGRGWKYNSNSLKQESSSDDAFDKLGHIDYYGADSNYIEKAQGAIEWIRRLRTYGHRWTPVSRRHENLPSVKELYPNMSNSEDFPFHYAKKKIADEIDEITRVWRCGVRNRNIAHGFGKYRLHDVSIEDLDVNRNTQNVISTIIDRNNPMNNFIVTQRQELSADVISNNINNWQTEETKNDMYVDFETVSNINDDFSQFPKKNGTNMIWMIGCGFRNSETKKWDFKNFIADRLIPSEEYKIISEWLTFMEKRSKNPRIFHWSTAEQYHLERAKTQHRGLRNLNIRWVDMHNVFVKEPFTIKSAYNFKLKEIARAFKKWNFIETEWTNSYVDGIGASVAAWKCDDKFHTSNKSLKEYDIIHEVEDYNEIDCKVIFEIVNFLRKYLDE